MKSRSITRTLRCNLIGGKLTATVGTGDFVSRHRGVPKIRLRGLLAARAEVGRARLLLFSRSGFDADVITHARRRGDVELVDLARLYDGD